MKEQRGNQVKDSFVNVKNYFIQMPPKRKVLFGGIGVVIIVAAIIATVLLNSGKNEYTVLYSNLEASEATEIYTQLVDLGAEPQINGTGEILVRTGEVDMWLLKLAAEGYPKSTLPYDIFERHTGLTSTESDRKQALIQQTQNRLQDTLGKIDGVLDATVTISIPETSDYVWQQAQDNTKGTASVTLKLRSGVTLSMDQVTAIKNLVAASVPKLEAADVVVIDAGTGLELMGNDDDGDYSLTSNRNLQFKQAMERQIEDKIYQLLSLTYGRERMRAVANVVLDYDKMITESYELLGRKDADGVDTQDGFIDSYTDTFNVNGVQGAGGLVGEDPNTDIPEYPYGNPNEDGGVTNFGRDARYIYGYIKQQVEKGSAALQQASISVMVDERNLTAVRQQELMNLISTSTGIDVQFITVAPLDLTVVEPVVPPEPEPVVEGIQIPLWVWFVVGGALLLVIILVVVILLLRKRAKRIVEQKDAAIVDSMQSMEDEIEKYKRELEEAARAQSDPKDDAIMDEVRSFAKENPEITANLLRTWLKEGEE